MNKLFKVLTICSFALSFLVACQPSLDPDASSSSSSEQHQHVPGDHWEYDEENHWHSCTICGVHLDEANHTFDGGTPIESGVRYTCTVCDYYYDVTDPVGDELEAMNQEISGKTFIDPFAVREYLLAKNYHFDHTLVDGSKYGYSKEHSKVVEYKDNAVTRPTDCIGDDYVSFSKVSVSDFASLATTVNKLNTNECQYNIINIDNDIEQLASSPLVKYTNGRDLEINLNNHHIHANTEVDKDYQTDKWFTLQFVDSSMQSSIYIHNGFIEANRKMKSTGVEDDSCCLSLVAAKTFRLNGLNLKGKSGTQCIGDMSEDVLYWHNKEKKVYISDVVMEAPLRALTIAGGTWDIKNCSSIKGMVCIDGGKVDIDNVVVDASKACVTGLNEYEKGYSNAELVNTIVTNINGQEVYTTVGNVVKSYRGAMNFNDAINVLSRRMNIYDVAKVTVKNSSLTPVIVDDVVTGYGFRYWDLGDTSCGEEVVPILENNQYPRFDSGTGFGGSNLG